mmetsp:Transcript_6483/g.7526  ORF Transcript_6483/g.7526 Transcript_6483/m.7526 type:complete len:89 (+) Transcript_6483:3-269(+)
MTSSINFQAEAGSAESSSSSSSSTIMNDTDGIDATQTPPTSQSDTLTAINLSQDTDDFVKIAMEEALTEVRTSEGGGGGDGVDADADL